MDETVLTLIATAGASVGFGVTKAVEAGARFWARKRNGNGNGNHDDVHGHLKRVRIDLEEQFAAHAKADEVAHARLAEIMDKQLAVAEQQLKTGELQLAELRELRREHDATVRQVLDLRLDVARIAKEAK